jgi:hypothetical protein
LQLKIRHPNLFTFSAKDFSLRNFCEEYDLHLSQYKAGALVEMPHESWLPIIEAMRRQDVKVIYELIDEWDSALGQNWYNREVELQMVQLATALTATAPILKSRLEELTRRPVCLLPNAVNLHMFNWRKTYPMPIDLPPSDRVITYIGALYGNWFDWDLLVDIARALPQVSVVVIGDYRGQCPVTLPNLYFLGLKPQSNLPAYLAYSTVGIIPWKVNDITQATSPLKLYEYLAMHVPVVVPDLLPLQGIPSVYRSNDRETFLLNIQVAMDTHFDSAIADEFITQNSWEARVNQLIQLLDFNDTPS